MYASAAYTTGWHKVVLMVIEVCECHGQPGLQLQAISALAELLRWHIVAFDCLGVVLVAAITPRTASFVTHLPHLPL